MGRKPVLTRIPDQIYSPVGAGEADLAEDGDEDGTSKYTSSKPAARFSRTPTVIVEVMGKEIHVGKTLGKQIREAMVQSGASEDEAMLVHREHARLEPMDGMLFLRRIGENSLRVNGREVDKDERVRIADGDVLTFSDVVKADIRIEEPGADSGPQISRPLKSQEWMNKERDVAAGIGMQHSLNILINTIPGEVLVLWAALEGARDLYDLPVWASGIFLALVVIATPVYVYRSIDHPDEMPSERIEQWWQEANVQWQSVSATGAFLVWVYYLGGPFKAAGLQYPAVATVLVIIYPIMMVISPYYGSLILYQISN